MGATDEILHTRGTYRDISPWARLVLAWGGIALVVFAPLISPLLFTSAYGFWVTFGLLLGLGVLMWLIGMNITMRRPNFFYLIAAVYAVILGIANLVVTNTYLPAILLDKYRLDPSPYAKMEKQLFWENLWIVLATAAFVALFILLHANIIRRRKRVQKRASNGPRYQAEYA